MHEAGIAAGILEIAGVVAAGRGSNVKVRKVKVRLGMFTGVAVEALEFAFESLRSGTSCAEAALEIERVPVVGLCSECGWSGPPLEDFCSVCSTCGAPVTLLSGRELDVEYVDLDEGVQGVFVDGESRSRNQDPEEER